MAPHALPSPDWVFSISSNVHICNNRASFTTYTPFATHIVGGPFETDLGVLGVGIVLLPAASSPSHNHQPMLRLVEVLHAPAAPYNVVGGMAILRDGGGFSLGGGGGIHNDEGRQVAFFRPDAPPPLLVLNVPNSTGQSILQHLGGVATVSVHWTADERARWLRFEAWSRFNPPPSSGKRKADADPCCGGEMRQIKRQTQTGFLFTHERDWEERRAMVWDVMVE